MNPSYGTSTFASLEFICDRARKIRPTSVLDVGCGWGRWGFLMREFLDIWDGRFATSDWRTHITGLDINPNNYSPMHHFLYDSNITADIADWAPALISEFPDAKFDLIIACDVIEHMEKRRALDTLWCLSRLGTDLLIGIPLGNNWLRAGREDNPHEAHLSQWDWPELHDNLKILSSKEVDLTWPEESGHRYGLMHARGK